MIKKKEMQKLQINIYVHMPGPVDLGAQGAQLTPIYLLSHATSFLILCI